MLNEHAKAWIAALRSGEYTQGEKALRVLDTYCCLGVACDMASKKGLTSATWIKNHPLDATPEIFQNPDTGLRAAACLSAEIAALIGLKCSTGSFTVDERIVALFPELEVHLGTCYSLMSVNDDLKFSFWRIADLLEAEPRDLFWPTV